MAMETIISNTYRAKLGEGTRYRARVVAVDSSIDINNLKEFVHAITVRCHSHLCELKASGLEKLFELRETSLGNRVFVAPSVTQGYDVYTKKINLEIQYFPDPLASKLK